MTADGDRRKDAATAAQKVEQTRSIALPPKPRGILAGYRPGSNVGSYAGGISTSVKLPGPARVTASAISDSRRRISFHLPLLRTTDCDPTARQILLIAKIAIGCDEHVEASAFCSVEQFTVSKRVPTSGARFLDRMSLQGGSNSSRRSVIQKDAHQALAESRLRAANSRTARTCSRVTGNCSITSSMVNPSSRFSKMVTTGVRVPLNSHTPLTLPGMRSTAGH